MRSLASEAAAPAQERIAPRARRRILGRLDLVAVGLVAAAIGSTMVAALDDGGEPAPVIWILVGALATYLVSSAISRRHRWAVPLLVLLAAGAVAVANADGLFERSPSLVPFGYAHHMWAFFLQAALAGGMLAVLKAPLPVRIGGAAVGMAFGLVAFGGSPLGPVAVTVVAAVALVLRRPGWVRAGIAAAGVLLLGVVVASTVLGATYTGLERWGSPNMLLEATSNRCDLEPGCSLYEARGFDRSLYRAVTERRVALWHDALILMRDHPLTGVGPGRFRATSPLALGDPDEPWAHHEFLHQGAETGVPGMLLLLAIFAWPLYLLFRTADGAALIVAAAVAALGIHACLDYVLHFPAAPLALAGLVGAAVRPAPGGAR